MRDRNKAKMKIDAKVKRFSRLYAQMKLNGYIDYNKLVRTWNIKEQNPEYKCRRLLRTKVISDMVTEEIIKLYNENGITPDFVIKQELELLSKAKDKDDLTNAIKIIANFRESMDFKPKQQTAVSIQTDYIKMIDKNKGSIEAKQVKQIESNNDLKPE